MTIQSLRMFHDMSDVEIVVVDNFGCEYTRDLVINWTRQRYIPYSGVVGTSAPRDLIFREATGDAVLVIDCHVMLKPGVVARLKKFFTDNPLCQDLLQGPMYNDDLRFVNTHMNPIWREHMWGAWGRDPRGVDEAGEPFDIPMHGLGLFACRKDAWLGFNPAFRGFGGEEGYIHEKFRQAGRRCLCLPWLRWLHRFNRPYGAPYELNIEDRIRNYLIGHYELGLDLEPVIKHFIEFQPAEKLISIAADCLGFVDIKPIISKIQDEVSSKS